MSDEDRRSGLRTQREADLQISCVIAKRATEAAAGALGEACAGFLAEGRSLPVEIMELTKRYAVAKFEQGFFEKALLHRLRK